MKKFLFIALTLTLSFNAFAETRARVWAEIPIYSAGNFHEFETQMKKTRDQTRKMLWEEFGQLFLPAMMMGAEVGRAAKALAEVLIMFDRMHDEHMAKAHEGIPAALERHVLAAFDELYRQHGLSDEERRAELVRQAGWGEALLAVRRGQASLAEKEALYRAVFQNIDWLVYGTYTVIRGGQISLILTAENYRTGATSSFRAQGTPMEAAEGAAEQMFEFFQANARESWKNPLPQLEWHVPPANLMGRTLAREARLYCDGQGARLPFARELILASQGSNYRRGGIPAIKDRDIFAIADLHRWAEQHYYFGMGHGTDDPRGPIRTNAGYGTIYPNFVCVRGEMSRVVRWEQDLYRMVRKAWQLPAGNAERTTVENAVEWMLMRLDAYGHKGSWVEKNHQSIPEALQALESVGVEISPELRERLNSEQPF